MNLPVISLTYNDGLPSPLYRSAAERGSYNCGSRLLGIGRQLRIAGAHGTWISQKNWVNHGTQFNWVLT